jgi:hypothetical protein
MWSMQRYLITKWIGQGQEPATYTEVQASEDELFGYVFDLQSDLAEGELTAFKVEKAE